jgi:hypothetical protein
LQLFLAVLHSDVPLQEFTPVQWTVAASAATDTLASPELNNIAAEAAIAAVDNLLICILKSSIVMDRSDIAALTKDPANGLIITPRHELMPVSSGAASKRASGSNDSPEDLCFR